MISLPLTCASQTAKGMGVGGYDSFETGAGGQLFPSEEDGGTEMEAVLSRHRRHESMDLIHPGILASAGSSTAGYPLMRGHHRRTTTPEQMSFDRASYMQPPSEMSTTHFDEELLSPELSPRISMHTHSRRASMVSVKSSDDRSSRQRHSVFCSEALQQLMDSFGFNLSGVPVGLSTKGPDRHNFNRPFVIDKKGQCGATGDMFEPGCLNALWMCECAVR